MALSASEPTSLTVVAGASGAIGMAVTEALASAGHAVIGTYRSHRLKPAPGVVWVRFDGADEQDTAELREALAADARPLTAVVCCIGAPSSKRRIADTEPEEFAHVFAANVTASYACGGRSVTVPARLRPVSSCWARAPRRGWARATAHTARPRPGSKP